MTPTRGGERRIGSSSPKKEHPVIVKLEVSNEIDPTRWEGETDSGRKVFIRFSFGVLVAEYDESGLGETIFHEAIEPGPHMGQYMTTEEMVERLKYYIDFRLPDW